MSEELPVTPATKPKAHGGLAMALDYGPLVIFFIAYKILGIFGGTAVFMLAITIAILIALWKIGRVSPMQWLSAILVVGFGALTLWFHDPKFIQLKPTIIYVMLGGLLLGGLAIGKPLLKVVLEHGYDGLTERGWTLLSRNWAIFFLVLAVANEIARQQFSFDTWLTIKVWGVTIASILFAMANVPMLMKHGLGEEGVAAQN
jgi:intracellular septation protein